MLWVGLIQLVTGMNRTKQQTLPNTRGKSPAWRPSDLEIDFLPAFLSSVQSLSRSVVSNSLWPPELQHTRPPCREGNSTPLQYSCLENPMDSGAWWTTVHGVAKSRTRLSNFTFTLHFHALEKEMATHSSVLVWRIPGAGEPGGLLSMEPHRVGHDWSNLAAAAAGLPVHHQLPEFTQTHVHQVGDAIQPSHPLSSPSPLAPHPSQHQLPRISVFKPLIFS